MSSAAINAGSPKFSPASPGRVRHNPYASPSHGAASGTPTTPPMPGSLGASFTSAAPQTPPVAHWDYNASHGKVNASFAAAVHDFSDHGIGIPAMPQVSFGSEDFVAAASHPAAFSHQYSQDFSQSQQSVMFPAPYEPAMDPAMAFFMYNAASAAAAQAAQQQLLVQVGGPVPNFDAMSLQHRGGARRSEPTEAQPVTIPTFDELQAYAGTLAEHARTAQGSSFIQSAIKDSTDARSLPFVWSELAPALGDLLLDAHGCYVIKTLLERLPEEQVDFVLRCVTSDEQLGFSVCTHSLHTRRVVQHIIESVNGDFLAELMSRHCVEVATTQQGCIVMQRSMDHAAPGPHRDALFTAICSNLVRFAKDPFANYVVQHLMEIGDRGMTSEAMWKAFRGHVVELACNKFASNVIEKCLFHCTADIQHEMLLEMYSVGHQGLYSMLQDSFGNYIIQSSIALATFRDISLIDERLRPVLAHTPYGYKIEARLDRRLKGKPVTARPTPTPGSNQSMPNVGPTAAAAVPSKHRSAGRGNRTDAKVPEGEVPW